MTTTNAHDNHQLLRDLHDAVERLADEMHDDVPIANAIRGFARTIRREASAAAATASRPRRVVSTSASPVRDVLYAALDGGALDGGRFDFLMLADNRASRRRSGSPRRG